VRSWKAARQKKQPPADHFAFAGVLGQQLACPNKMPNFLNKPCPFRTALTTQIVTA
jgi:hypothetical protein